MADYPDLLVGLQSPDDAAVWRLDEARALVVTTDFFTPVVDDPFDYGQVAAANALSDVYAMGGVPLLALNVAAMPPELPVEVVAEIIRGGAVKVREAGAVIAGGHTIQDKEPKYGLVVVGMVDPARMMTKEGLQAGHVLVLSKPLGMGVTTTALKRGLAVQEDVDQAVDWMTRLNAAAAQLAPKFGSRACTDVTGFGLLGHGAEMAQASSVGMELSLPAIPFLEGAPRYARQGTFPGGSADNRLFFGSAVEFDPAIDEFARMLLFDAQTSGGLLFAVEPAGLEPLMEEAAGSGVSLWPIGRAVEGEGIRVRGAALDLPAATTKERVWFHPAF
jgi:selenide,water dikinase